MRGRCAAPVHFWLSSSETLSRTLSRFAICGSIATKFPTKLVNHKGRAIIRHAPRCTPATLRGFTLLELVISAALMSLILVTTYLCLSSGISSRKLIESRAEAAQSARVALAIMSADLRAACPMSKDIPFLGMQRTLEDVEADNLDFATHNYTPRRAGEGDFCEISYFLGKDKESGKLLLWRRRHPGIPLEPFAGGRREELARGVRGLKFEYYDGFKWFSTWGDADGKGKAENSFKERPNLVGMPEAVRITLWFEADPGSNKKSSTQNDSSDSTLAFQTVARLNLAALALRESPNPSATRPNDSTQTNPNPPSGGIQ